MSVLEPHIHFWFRSPPMVHQSPFMTNSCTVFFLKSFVLLTRNYRINTTYNKGRVVRHLHSHVQSELLCRKFHFSGIVWI